MAASSLAGSFAKAKVPCSPASNKRECGDLCRGIAEIGAGRVAQACEAEHSPSRRLADGRDVRRCPRRRLPPATDCSTGSYVSDRCCGRKALSESDAEHGRCWAVQPRFSPFSNKTSTCCKSGTSTALPIDVCSRTTSCCLRCCDGYARTRQRHIHMPHQ